MYTQHLARPPSLLVVIRSGAAMQWPIHNPELATLADGCFVISLTQFGYYSMNLYDVHGAHEQIVFFFFHSFAELFVMIRSAK